MNVKRFVSVSVLAATCVFTFNTLSAQTLSRDNGPAEVPPSSFTANQYVDSKGCVYIRAGVDGNTNWVPRVTRKRTVVCGMTPSLGATRTATASAPAAAPAAPAPVQIGAAAASAVVAPKSPAPAAVQPARRTLANALAPRPVRTVASTPVIKQRVAPTIRTTRTARPSTFIQQPAPSAQTARIQAPQRRVTTQPQIISVAPRKAQAQQPRRISRNTQRNARGAQTCRGASAVSQRYIGGREGAVRCGPQTQGLVTQRAGDVKGGTFRSATGQVLNMANVNPNARVVPRHVYEQQQAANVVTPTPQGYRNAWQDDRLNPRRAHQTLGGKAQSDLVWTQTVPRRLIVRSTGRDVTRAYPGLQYPYTSAAQQNAAWSQGTRVVSTQGTTQRVQKRKVARQQAVVSTRSTAPRKPAQVAGKRYVQVGTFGVASNAQKTAQRLQRMGLPVRIGKFSRGGKQMRIVLAGPFGSSARGNGALQAVRSAGFRDAFARN